MVREFTDKPPSKLIDRLETSHDIRRFRRRAVLTNGNGRWELVCCTVEGFLLDESTPQTVNSRRYRQAILYEEFLTGEECLRFVSDVQEGHAQFGDIDLQRGQNSQWATELLPVNNDYMARAGYVISLGFAQHGNRASVSTLLASDQPYYPEIDDAARDWLPFPMYHGHSDARNDQIIFLLPETRAFIASAIFSEKGTLDITVAGAEVDLLSLQIKGAYWEEKSMHHVDANVIDARAALVVPVAADRLEYYLIDREGTVYDFHREDRFSRLTSNRNALGSVKHPLEDQVRGACRDGEGLHVEFKPFIAPEDKFSLGSKKTKLREVVTTVVAFANTNGGNIYLGIDDDCIITGIGQDLQKWAESAVDDSVINKYLGALKNKIKEVVHGEVALHLAHAVIGDALVVVIEVPPSPSKPISLQQDQYLYVRTGASNRKLPPDQWMSVLQSDKLHSLF
ncbi:AlbA family DNA-binding domain-containing protein [Thiobacillus sp.]